jgi:hypothetical protein
LSVKSGVPFIGQKIALAFGFTQSFRRSQGLSKMILEATKRPVTADPARHGLLIFSLLSKGDSPFGQVVWGHFYHNFVAWQDPNEVQTHFS